MDFNGQYGKMRMQFGGFQDCSFVDFPGRICSVAFVAGCNLRCRFCHNSLLVTRTGEVMFHDANYIFRRMEELSGKIDSFCLSGGEPLIYPPEMILDFFIELCEINPMFIKLDTNGTFPERMEYIFKAGLVNYVAMDIKDVPESYGNLCGPNADPSRIRRSIGILNSSHVSHEYRTTVIGNHHDDESIKGICDAIGKGQTLYLQPFVQNESNIDSSCLIPPTKEQLEHFRQIALDKGVEAIIRQ